MGVVLLRPAVFLDLNGTLVLPVVPESLGDYRLIEGASEAVALLCRSGFVCPVVTVQSKVGKGLFTEMEFLAWFGELKSQVSVEGALLEGPYVCPHRYAEPCGCKKSGGALHRRAAAELGLDLSSSFVVGDSSEDIDAAQLLGCEAVLVRTGWPVSEGAEQRCGFVATSVLEASRWIVASQAAAQQAAAPDGRVTVDGRG